ncbi:hypothetical protein [Legionella septentrionalis]|uniref:hypothetical protein n=1 Tax=Legionella septentrionalis TaxID=2498109 RepID=UPI0018F5E00A|nr:hypothetical protein [Legionella septentrionalis]
MKNSFYVFPEVWYWQLCPFYVQALLLISPLRILNARPESRVGVVGLSGLGHMAVKIGVAVGALTLLIYWFCIW